MGYTILHTAEFGIPPTWKNTSIELKCYHALFVSNWIKRVPYILITLEYE